MTNEEILLLRAWREEDAELRIPDSPLGWAIVHAVDAVIARDVPVASARGGGCSCHTFPGIAYCSAPRSADDGRES